MCWESWVGLSILGVHTVALLGLFYLNWKNRKLAEQGVASVLVSRAESRESLQSVQENAAIISRVVDGAIAEPAPALIPNPPPTKEVDLEERVDK